MDFTCNKKKIASLAAVGGVVAVFGLGYGVTLSNFDDTLQLAKNSLASYLNKSLNTSEESHISVEIVDDKSGVFSRNLSIVVVGGNDKIKVPAKANIGLLSYSFEFDLAKATGNDQNFFVLTGLDKVTSVDATGKYNVLSSDFKFELNASYLNNFKILAESVNPHEVASLKERLGYRDIGNASFIFTIDDEENIKSSITVDSFSSAMGISFVDLAYASTSKGLNTLQNFGTHQFHVKDLALFTGNRKPVYKVDAISFGNDASRVHSNGDFNSNYYVNISNLGSDVKDIAVKGTINNLNVQSMNDVMELVSEQSGNLDLYTIIDYFINHPVNVTVDPSSSFTYVAQTKEQKWSKPQTENVVFNMEGKLNSMGNANTNKGETAAVDGYLKVTTPFDLSKIVSERFQSYQYNFVQDSNKYQSLYEISISPLNPELNTIKLNGKAL